MSQTHDRGDDGIFITIALLIVVMVGIPALYAAKAESINDFCLALSKAQLKAFLPYSAEAQQAWGKIAAIDIRVADWPVIEKVLYYTGTWVRWPFAIILLILGAISIFMGRTGKLVRKFNMASLLANNAETFPCLRPIVGRGKELLDPESYDKGLWMVARTPLQFAIDNKLLLDARGKCFAMKDALKNGIAVADSKAFGKAILDEGKALAVFTKQLGKKWKGFGKLTSCRKALAAAFISYANGDKKGAVAILDEVSTSYHEKDNVASCPVLETEDFVKRISEAWETHMEDVLKEQIMARHTSFELSWFMALLYRARQKGVLASSQFLWLRPLDRPLWYALNQCGGRAAWAEAFAPWAHYTAEEKAGHSFTEPQVSGGVKSLKEALNAQGWLMPDVAPLKKSTGIKAQRQEVSPPNDVVTAAAEIDYEADYEAEKDPALKKEQE